MSLRIGKPTDSRRNDRPGRSINNINRLGILCFLAFFFDLTEKNPGKYIFGRS